MGNPWTPAAYQGRRVRYNYFEGWYFKQSGGSGEGIWSFIPGISKGDAEHPGYSFVQAIEGKTGKSWWFQYRADEFDASGSSLDIRVGPNHFGPAGIILDLSDGNAHIKGEFSFGPFAEMRFPVWSPGVMGPFSFVPFMECRHGLVSLDHQVDGNIEVDGRSVRMDGGRGYVEKDWGRSMPESWIWTQGNDFPSRGDSVMLSVARIPWLGSSFRGFLCTLRLNGETHMYATYNGARITELAVTDDEVRCTIKKRTETLEIMVGRTRGGILRAPVKGLLSRRIAEAADARIELIYKRPGGSVFREVSAPGGLETAGDIAALCHRS